jgi:hypothetical protein
VAHLEDERVLRERLADAREPDEVRVARVEEERELAEQRTEPAGREQRRESGAERVAIGERPRRGVVVTRSKRRATAARRSAPELFG